MNIESFIKKRKLIIICLLSDLILLFSFYFSLSFLRINFLTLFSFGFLYLLSGYVLGKYELLFPKNFKLIFNFAYKYFFLFLINYSLQLIYCIFKTQNYYSILKYNILFLLSSFLIQIIILFILSRKNNTSIWLSCFSKQSRREIENYIERYNKINLTKIKLLDINEIDYLNIKSNIKGFIFEDSKLVDNDNNIREFLNENTLIPMNIIDWSNYYLELLPINFLNKYYLKNNVSKINFKKKYYYIKRLGDIFVSSLLLIISLPLMFLVSILIKIEDGGPILYFQKRTGLNCKIFNICKFRSMKIDAENEGIQWSTRSDSRITKIGKFIRLTRIDELPQLISIIKGEMSLIGPRPERPEINEVLFKETNIYKCRYLIKPGLSGWAQVNYNYAASIKESKIKLGYDIYYLRNSSFLLDSLIIFKTIKIILNLKGALPN